MAFALPRISRPKPGPKPKARPSYSPKTEQDITLSMMNLALKGPRWVGENMGKDLDEAFNVGETRVSLAKLIRHPIKTVKGLAKAWTVSSWKSTLSAEIVAEHIWEPRLAHFVQGGSITDAEKRDILDWVAKSRGHKKDLAFEQVELLRGQGAISDDVWAGIHRQHQWDEFARFRRKPGRYLWEKVAGKRGTKKGPLYKYTPQKWLGEPLGRALGATKFGQAIAGIKHSARVLLRKVVDKLKVGVRAVGRLAAKGAKWVVTKVAGQATWTAISTAIATALGTVVAPVIGTVIGFLAGPAISKLFSWFIKIACLGCGCVAAGFVAFIAFVVIVVGGAFRPPDTGGMGPTQLVEMVKTVSPTNIDKGAVWPDTEVSYTITVTNKTDKEITDGILVDTHNPADFNANTLSGGDWDPATGTLTWSNITIAPSDSFSVRPKGGILGTDVDKVVINNASFTGILDGDPVSAGGSAVVIVGSPLGQPPQGWPTDRGCVTQGPGGSFSHGGVAAVDIGKLTGDGTTHKVYATHDGIAYAYTGPDGPFSAAAGKYVEVISHGGTFRTYYAHLLSHSILTGGVSVARGDALGIMGATGTTDGGAHVHYEFRGTYEGTVLEMKPPYIPADVGPCSDACNCCFSGFDGACGSAP